MPSEREAPGKGGKRKHESTGAVEAMDVVSAEKHVDKVARHESADAQNTELQSQIKKLSISSASIKSTTVQREEHVVVEQKIQYSSSGSVNTSSSSPNTSVSKTSMHESHGGESLKKETTTIEEEVTKLILSASPSGAVTVNLAENAPARLSPFAESQSSTTEAAHHVEIAHIGISSGAKAEVHMPASFGNEKIAAAGGESVGDSSNQQAHEFHHHDQKQSEVRPPGNNTTQLEVLLQEPDKEIDPKEIEKFQNVDPEIKVKVLATDADFLNHYIDPYEIGRTACAVVYRVRDAESPENFYAMKCLPKRTENENNLVNLYKEMMILNRILPSNRDIVQVHDLMISPGFVYIVTELCSTRTLKEFYQRCNEDSARWIFGMLANAVRFLHSYGVVHGDLHSGNVLFTFSPRFNEARIIDFGLSSYIPGLATKINRDFDAHKWFTPEELVILQRKIGIPEKDVRDLGRILHYMMIGQWMFPAVAANSKPRPIFSAKALDLLKKIGPDPFGPALGEKFLTIDDICQHPWLVDDPKKKVVAVTGKPQVIISPPPDLKAASSTRRFSEFNRPGMGYQIGGKEKVRQSAESLHFSHRLERIMPNRTLLRADDEVFTLYYTKMKAECVRTNIAVCTPKTEPDMRVFMKIVKKLPNHGDHKAFPNSPKMEFFRLYTELLILRRILPRHDNIIRLKDLLISRDYVYVVTDLCRWSSLIDFFPFATNTSARIIFKQLAQSVQFMHAYGVVNRNLHPKNIIFEDVSFKRFKLVDFSLATYQPEGATMKADAFFISEWLSPDELPIVARPHSPNLVFASDIKALGIILLAMLIGDWEDSQSQDVKVDRLRLLKRRKLKFDNAAYDLLAKLGPEPLAPCPPGLEMDIDGILRHPWLAQNPRKP